MEELSIEEQLRIMQQQLKEISGIPLQIQSTIAMVTKTFQKFLPPQPVEPVVSVENEMNGDMDEEVEDETDFEVTMETLFDESCVLDVIPEREYESPFEDEMEVIVEETEEEIKMNEQLERERLLEIEKQQKVWFLWFI